MRSLILAFVSVLSIPAFASLTFTQQDYVISEVQSGNSSVMSLLNFDGVSLSDANVDVERFIDMVLRGDQSLLSDPKLALAETRVKASNSNNGCWVGRVFVYSDRPECSGGRRDHPPKFNKIPDPTTNWPNSNHRCRIGNIWVYSDSPRCDGGF